MFLGFIKKFTMFIMCVGPVFSSFSMDFMKSQSNINQALFDAIDKGNLQDAQQAIEELGADVDAPDSRGISPLKKAALKGNLALVMLLVKKGAKVNEVTTHMKSTALIAAASMGHSAVVRFLILNKANLNEQNPNKYTALHEAYKFGHWETARLLLMYGATATEQEINYIVDNPLENAAARGDINSLLDILANDNYEIRSLEHLGNALALAIGRHGRSMTIIRLLLPPVIDGGMYLQALGIAEYLQRISDNDVQRSYYTNIIDAIRKAVQDAVNDTQVKSGHAKSKEEQLHEAARKGNITKIRTLLEDRLININARNEQGETPLHIAVLCDHAVVVKLLLADPRIQVNAQDNISRTPLFLLACFENYFTIPQELHMTMIRDLIGAGSLIKTERLWIEFGDSIVWPMIRECIMEGMRFDIDVLRQHPNKIFNGQGLLESLFLGRTLYIQSIAKSTEANIIDDLFVLSAALGRPIFNELLELVLLQKKPEIEALLVRAFCSAVRGGRITIVKKLLPILATRGLIDHAINRNNLLSCLEQIINSEFHDHEVRSEYRHVRDLIMQVHTLSHAFVRDPNQATYLTILPPDLRNMVLRYSFGF